MKNASPCHTESLERMKQPTTWLFATLFPMVGNGLSWRETFNKGLRSGCTGQKSAPPAGKPQPTGDDFKQTPQCNLQAPIICGVIKKCCINKTSENSNEVQQRPT
ncbi:hypothetical protein AVEN_194006-1 [Araneus ventricosus]|uniref:Uncharacterized protein n=1 Tax=Araneus ventricosus TaxID=182803 RepID=A0A4Y2LDS8_ARAVE|nr:hypothetical protein AVEN_194003-1 [Araneus ventricosus]GBN11510.1 hypothetical protein AVEN_194006-1 [Araneus ventricosus]